MNPQANLANYGYVQAREKGQLGFNDRNAYATGDYTSLQEPNGTRRRDSVVNPQRNLVGTTAKLSSSPQQKQYKSRGQAAGNLRL